MPKYVAGNKNTSNRRVFVIVSVMFAGLLASGCVTQPAAKPTKILFVCQAGTAKSPIAREIFKQRAKARGIAVVVFSRGITVEDHVSPELRQRLRADGIDSTAEPAMPLKPQDWAAADILVNFNPLPASINHPDIRDWTDVPSVNDDYENARTIMNNRIEALLTDVAKRRNRR